MNFEGAWYRLFWEVVACLKIASNQQMIDTWKSWFFVLITSVNLSSRSSESQLQIRKQRGPTISSFYLHQFYPFSVVQKQHLTPIVSYFKQQFRKWFCGEEVPRSISFLDPASKVTIWNIIVFLWWLWIYKSSVSYLFF